MLAGAGLGRGGGRPFQRAAGLGEEDVVEARLVQLEIRDSYPGLVEGADDVGELLASILQPDGGALRSAGDELTEGPEQLRGAIVVGMVRRHDLHGRAADL